jgi:UDP-N-acetylglucosamine--N-acetylmuramyl-(pentapeptide) pyrophosphoryl-undecaprenol N-acetylglucosamine transferase
MKKILMSVVGIGLGHATRSEAIYKKLRGKAKLKILTYYDSYNYYKKVGIPCEDFGGYIYKGDEYAFDVLLQMIDFFKNPTKLRDDYKRFRKSADEFKPDIIFSDSEPNAFFYGYRRGLPNFVLTNLITTLSNYGAIPRNLRTHDVSLQKAMINRLIGFMMKRGGRFFVPSFESNVKYMDNVNYVDLIVRQKPSELPQKSKLRKKLGINKEFYLVHVGGAAIERYLFPIVESVLSQFEDRFFVVSSNGATNKVIRKDNMLILPFIKNQLEYLKLAEGIISPAGHSTISEAVVFKKPIMAVPVRNHVEQLVNAALVEKEDFGKACFFGGRLSINTFRKSLVEFFKHEEEYKSNLKSIKLSGNGASQIARGILKGY